MPQNVPVQAVANQTLSITLNSALFEIAIRTTNGCTSVSVTINGVDVIDNLRAVAGQPIIPSQYQENGNLMFLTNNEDVPFYTDFNVSQSLTYFTPTELVAYREVNYSPVTAAEFNPLGGLPLRFAPQGY